MTTEGKLAGFVLIVAFIFAGPGSSERFSNMGILVRSPASATVTTGQSVLLDCGFDLPGNCSWTLNAVVVTISDRYQYYGDGYELLNYNCWIGIKMVKEQDAGNWTCTYQRYINETWISSSHSAYLHVAGNDKEISEPNPSVTQTDDVNVPMLTAIIILAVILVIIIAVGITYIVRLRRAKRKDAKLIRAKDGDAKLLGAKDKEVKLQRAKDNQAKLLRAKDEEALYQREKDATPHIYEVIDPYEPQSVQYIPDANHAITEPRYTSKTETTQRYLIPRQIQIDQNKDYDENGPESNYFDALSE